MIRRMLRPVVLETALFLGLSSALVAAAVTAERTSLQAVERRR